MYLHIWEGFIHDIIRDLKTDGVYWAGLTRDYNEEVRTFTWDSTEIEDIDEYITDLLRYKDDEFEFETTREVYELILDFFIFAKENNLTVLGEWD